MNPELEFHPSDEMFNRLLQHKQAEARHLEEPEREQVSAAISKKLQAIREEIEARG